MNAKFCRAFCGHCSKCRTAWKEVETLDAVYATLSEEDLNSLHYRAPDDPRTFALDHRGRP